MNKTISGFIKALIVISLIAGYFISIHLNKASYVFVCFFLLVAALSLLLPPVMIFLLSSSTVMIWAPTKKQVSAIGYIFLVIAYFLVFKEIFLR